MLIKFSYIATYLASSIYIHSYLASYSDYVKHKSEHTKVILKTINLKREQGLITTIKSKETR